MALGRLLIWLEEFEAASAKPGNLVEITHEVLGPFVDEPDLGSSTDLEQGHIVLAQSHFAFVQQGLRDGLGLTDQSLVDLDSPLQLLGSGLRVRVPYSFPFLIGASGGLGRINDHTALLLEGCKPSLEVLGQGVIAPLLHNLHRHRQLAITDDLSDWRTCSGFRV